MRLGLDTAVILSAGLGTRMRPLTLTTPKPLLPLAGRPILAHVLERLMDAGVTQIIVNAHYLADQIEDSLHQLVEEHDDSQNAFLCRVLGMYSAQLESKHQGLGDRIAETCQEVYVTVREFDQA